MALLGQADWVGFLSADSDAPPDVFFLVKGTDGKSTKIGAHRLLLAGISPVFKRMFFGPMKETENMLEVKETSPKAFRAMINYIYARRPQNVLYNVMDVDIKTLFELYALSDRYDILNLQTKIMGSLWEFELTRENLISTATVANSYKELFVDLSTELLMMCLKFYLELDTAAKENLPNQETNLDILDELMEVGRSSLHLTGKQDCFLKTFLNTVMQAGVP